MSTPRKKPPTKKPGPVTSRRPSAPATQQAMLTEVRELILTARQQVAHVVNAGLTILYWQIGTRIRQDILKEKRAAYGKEIIPELGRHLEAEFGRGFGVRNLFRMVRFAEVFPDREIVSSLMTQLGWTHLHIIRMDDWTDREGNRNMIRGCRAACLPELEFSVPDGFATVPGRKAKEVTAEVDYSQSYGQSRSQSRLNLAGCRNSR